jgi:hypothetical protein
VRIVCLVLLALGLIAFVALLVFGHDAVVTFTKRREWTTHRLFCSFNFLSIRDRRPGLSRPAEGQRVEVSLIGRALVKGRMRPPCIVEVEITADRLPGFFDGVIGVQINFLVFDRAPETFDEHVVTPGTFAIHANLYAAVDQHPGEFTAGELTRSGLRPRVRVERSGQPGGYAPHLRWSGGARNPVRDPDAHRAMVPLCHAARMPCASTAFTPNMAQGKQPRSGGAAVMTTMASSTRINRSI